MSHTISGNLNKDLEGKPSAPVFVNETPAYVPNNEKNYYMRIFRSSLNIFAHILIGITIGVTLFFSFEDGKLPLGSFVLHVLLCVIGYQLLMSEAILALCPHNGWSNFLRLADKKRAHTVLHIAGSVLGLVGCYIIIIEKDVHWTSLHGKYALVSMVFTVASLINGVTSLYAFEFRKCLPGNLSKVTHILFGIVAYATAAISLCYGFDKRSFKAWASPQFSYTLVGITACFTLICIITPIFNFFDKTIGALRR